MSIPIRPSPAIDRPLTPRRPGDPGRRLPHAAGLALGCAILLACPGAISAGDTTGPESQAEELESLRERIRNAESSIKAARDESERIMAELRRHEVAAAGVSGEIDRLNERIGESTESLASLDTERATREQELQTEREYLSRQIRVAYKTGRNDFVKLLLNQEDPALVGRMLVYHDYFNRARTRHIERVNASLARLADLRTSIQQERMALESMRADQVAKLEEMESVRASRQAAVAELNRHISDQGKELELMKRNEQELASLIEELRKDERAVEFFEETPPFDSLRGKLQWPARGPIATAFGEWRKGGRLRAQGVTIRVERGTEVHAVSAGKVIFADWFRNLGLLIIIDHGDGFMSLYGHNERLLKKDGDWIGSGDPIALAGDTGGQQQAGLYFEIRRNGSPQDPGIWCRG